MRCSYQILEDKLIRAKRTRKQLVQGEFLQHRAAFIRDQDLQRKVRVHKTGNLVVFAVDASWSMAAAERIERAVAHVIAEGQATTYDLKPRRDDPTAVGTQQMADAIIAAL